MKTPAKVPGQPGQAGQKSICTHMIVSLTIEQVLAAIARFNKLSNVK
jgi:hypothetical protein